MIDVSKCEILNIYKNESETEITGKFNYPTELFKTLLDESTGLYERLVYTIIEVNISKSSLFKGRIITVNVTCNQGWNYVQKEIKIFKSYEDSILPDWVMELIRIMEVYSFIKEFETMYDNLHLFQKIYLNLNGMDIDDIITKLKMIEHGITKDKECEIK